MTNERSLSLNAASSSGAPNGSSGGTQKNTPRYILSQNKKAKPARRTGYYGPPKCEVGTMFASRKECSTAGVHYPNIAGISCSTSSSRKDADTGAFSIVLSGGYEDDVDEGNVVYYTGAGGQTNNHEQSGNQAEDQSIKFHFNHALRLNISSGNPVRVVRGFKNPSSWAPREGYRYDGLYRVVNYEIIVGKSGHRVCRFKLERLRGQRPLDDLPVDLD